MDTNTPPAAPSSGMFSQKKLFYIVGAIVVIAIGVGVFFLMKRPATGPGAGGDQNQTPTTPQGPQTRQAAPTNVVVPDTTTKNLPADVAKPKDVAPSNSTGASYRDFDMKIANDTFSPDTVISRVGDTVNVNVTAVDKDYDLWQPDYGWRYKVPKGQTVRTQFTGTASGKFMFYCQSCGGPAKGPIGYFVIANK